MGILLNPYLTFNGNAREAMEFYASALGGSLEIQTFAESGQEDSEENKDKIMHARLEAGEVLLMASDSMPGRATSSGDNVSLSLQGTDRDGLTRAFEGLSDGGTVDMPLEEQFWGDTFGMLTDRFGIHWMVNIAKQ